MSIKSVSPSFFVVLFCIISTISFNHGHANAKTETTEPQQNQIVFSDQWLLSSDMLNHEKHGDTHHISQIDLNKSKNLYFAALLKQPLVEYLQNLAPSRPVNELLSKGNFKFVFYVNSKAVYEEALNTGAGTKEQKQKDLVLSKPLFSVNEEDSWGRFLWMRFMHFAGEEHLIEGKNTLKLELSAYIDSPQRLSSDVIASGELIVNVTKPKATKAEIAIQDIDENTSWQVSSQDYDEDKIRSLNKRIIENDFKDIRAIVVIKAGQLLIEQYYNGSNRNSLHDPRSVGKSFASTILGIAIQDGHIKNEAQKLSDFYDLSTFDNQSQAKSEVSLKQLLTMSSGFDGNDQNSLSKGNEENMYPTDDWVKFALDLPMTSLNNKKPKWTYFTAGTVLLGDMIHRSVPEGLEAYAHKTLFAPLGITQYQWQYTPQGVANTAGGLAMRAIDFAKVGQLYKNQGQWSGRQLLPKTWVEKSLSKQVLRGDDESEGHYGYLFWHDSFPFNDKIIEVAYASGNGGNKIYIFKHIDAVVVINSAAYNKPYAHSQVNQMMANYILPAIVDHNN